MGTGTSKETLSHCQHHFSRNYDLPQLMGNRAGKITEARKKATLAHLLLPCSLSVLYSEMKHRVVEACEGGASLPTMAWCYHGESLCQLSGDPDGDTPQQTKASQHGSMPQRVPGLCSPWLWSVEAHKHGGTGKDFLCFSLGQELLTSI